MPNGVEVIEDAREGRGPLQGLAAGLAAVDGRAEVAFVSSTDAPLLHPAFVRRVVGALDGGHDVALPQAGGFPHPLAAAYRTALLPAVEELIAADRMRPAFLFETCRVRRLDEALLLADPAVATFDPALDSVLNLNEPADYQAARARPAPEVAVRCYGAVRRGRGLANAARRPCRHAGERRGRGRPRARRACGRGAQRRPDHARSRRAPGRRRHRRLPRRRRRRVARYSGPAHPRLTLGTCPMSLAVTSGGRSSWTSRTASAEELPLDEKTLRALRRRGRSRHVSHAPPRAPRRRPARPRGAAGLRLLPAGRHPADDLGQVRGRGEAR